MPNRSNASRSNQLAPGQMSTTESMMGSSASSQRDAGAALVVRDRQQVIRHGEARAIVRHARVARFTPRLNPDAVAE
jgi:hypothetical protein